MKKILSLVFVSVLYLANAQTTLLTNLQACYPLDCNFRNYAPTASTPPSLDGTGSNVTCAVGHTGAANTAYQFNGSTTSYIKLPNDSRIKPDSISFTGWFYLDSLPNIQYLLYTKNNCTYNFEAYYLATYQDGLNQRFSVGKSNGSCTYATVNSITTLAIHNWYHVAFFINNSVIKLYINGSLDNSTTHSIAFSYNSAKEVFLGVTNESYYNLPFKGRMDNLRFYNRQLTATEVSDIYNRDPDCSATARPLGIQSQLFDENKNIVYPNPSAGKIFIENSSSNTIEVIDVVGKKVNFNQTKSGENTIELNINNSAEGIYFIKFFDATGTYIQTSKVVITR